MRLLRNSGNMKDIELEAIKRAQSSIERKLNNKMDIQYALLKTQINILFIMSLIELILIFLLLASVFK